MPSEYGSGVNLPSLIGGWGGFVGLGLGTELFALAILLVFFKRRRWF
jgi:hypothetical protein